MPRTTCPKCRAVLDLTADMVSQQIECGACQAVFLATPDDPPEVRRGEGRPSRRRLDDEDDRPSRHRRDEDEDEDRPSRRRSRDEEDAEDRPRRRRRPAGGRGQGLAVASLILGIVSIPLALCCWVLGIPVALIGGVLGIVHLVQGRSEGRGLAIAGVVCSGLGVVAVILGLVLGIAVNLANLKPNRQNNGPPFGPPPQNNKRPFGR